MYVDLEVILLKYNLINHADMPTIYNKFMAKYAPYSLLLIVLDCTGCKNQAASKNSGPRPNKSQDQHSVRNDSNIEQKNDATGCEVSDIHPKDGVTQVAHTDLDVKTNGESSQKDETKTQPNFNLKNITVAAGNQFFLMLEASGNTEGYTIKSREMNIYKLLSS